MSSTNASLPMIAIVTPVFNASRALVDYFQGLEATSYPRERIQIIMPDGGSTDGTQALAKKHGALVLPNKLKTGEAGKAVGVKYLLSQKRAPNDQSLQLVCFLDSDNIIVDADWFSRMIEPFQNDVVIGSEPWQYLYRPQDSYITRYTALIGMSDPIAMFLGNYDRQNILTGRWTDLPIKSHDMGRYLVWPVDPKVVPTIGANGAIFRLEFFVAAPILDYLFDIDVLYEYTQTHAVSFAKVKIGIVHTFCRTIADFIRKQRRRTKDYHYFQSKGLRTYPWKSFNPLRLYYFIFCCVTVVPLFWQAAKGASRRPDPAWLFHPLACWITLAIYGSSVIMNHFRTPELADRRHWTQS